MGNDEMVQIELICSSYNVEPAFIESLLDFGLIEITVIDENKFIESQKVDMLEKIIRMHYDLDINLEGIETILHLMERMNMLQEELNVLKNKLRFYEI